MYKQAMENRMRNHWSPQYETKEGIEYDKKEFISKLGMDDIIKTNDFIRIQKLYPEKINMCFDLFHKNLAIEEAILNGSFIPEKPISKKKKHQIETENYKNMKEICAILKSLVIDSTPIEIQYDIYWQRYLTCYISEFVSFLQCQRGLNLFY